MKIICEYCVLEYEYDPGTSFEPSQCPDCNHINFVFDNDFCPVEDTDK